MEFNFNENDAVEEVSRKVVESFGIDLENDCVSSILYKIGFECKSNYLSEETSSIVYYNPAGNVPNFNTGLGIITNKRFFDLNDNDQENIIILRDAIRFLTKPDFSESSTSINLRRIYEEETTYKVAEDLLNKMTTAKKSSKKILKMFVNK